MAFPVDTNNYKYIEEICMKEGVLRFYNPTIPLLLGHTHYVKEIQVCGYSASSDSILYNLGMTIDGEFDGDFQNTSVNRTTNGSVTRIQVNKLLQQKENFFVSKATTELTGNISRTFVTYKVSGDTNFKAKRVIYGLGDSIANPSSYVTRYNGHMWNIAKLEVNKSVANGGKAYDARLVVDSMSGKTSTDLVNTLKAGRKVIDQADVILFQHGVNDAYQGTTDLVWNQNLQYMIDWRDANYPNSKLVFLGATPLASSETTQNARLVQLRAIQATYEDIPNNVYYFGMDTIVLPNYNPSSTYFSDNVHPTQASQDLYGAGLGTYLKTIL